MRREIKLLISLKETVLGSITMHISFVIHAYCYQKSIMYTSYIEGTIDGDTARGHRQSQKQNNEGN